MADKTINQISEDTSPTADDYVASWDVGTGATKKITLANLLALIRSGGSGYAFASYVPTWTNATVGNGTVSAAYARIGNMVTVRVRFTLGSTSAISGSVSFSLPVTAVTYPGTSTHTIGWLHCEDTGTGNHHGLVTMSTTTTANVKLYNAGSTYILTTNLSSTVPFTWGSTDELFATIPIYEAA